MLSVSSSLRIPEEPNEMSRPERNSTPNMHFPTNSCPPVHNRSQFTTAELSEIPTFSLGPSLYDYVNTFLDNRSPIASDSPPDNPIPDRIHGHRHINRNL